MSYEDFHAERAGQRARRSRSTNEPSVDFGALLKWQLLDPAKQTEAALQEQPKGVQAWVKWNRESISAQVEAEEREYKD